MRTNNLRRWFLRGAILSAAAIAPLGVSQAAQADVTWHNNETAIVGVVADDADATDASPDDEMIYHTEDVTWH